MPNPQPRIILDGAFLSCAPAVVNATGEKVFALDRPTLVDADPDGRERRRRVDLPAQRLVVEAVSLLVVGVGRGAEHLQRGRAVHTSAVGQGDRAGAHQ